MIMKIHDLANKEFETKDEIVVELAEAITEVNEVVSEKERLEKENSEKDDIINSLKNKNLELLARIQTVVEEVKTDVEDDYIEEEDIWW